MSRTGRSKSRRHARTTLRKRRKVSKRALSAALELVRDPRLLYRAGVMIHRLGLIGEDRNCRIIVLAALTRTLQRKADLLIKAISGSGKNKTVDTSLRMLPQRWINRRTSISPQALVYAKGKLEGCILYITEVAGTKEAQYLLRIIQSEGLISRERTVIDKWKARTHVSRRVGRPVVITTTTAENIFKDDETRFLSLWIDDTPEQTHAILQSETEPQNLADMDGELEIWRQAFRLLSVRGVTFRYPQWFLFIAARVPHDDVRVRRDYPRFLAFCEAIALLRRFSTGHENEKEIEISFADYCVAYLLLNPIFSSTIKGVPAQEMRLANCVRRLHKELRRSVTAREIAKEVNWKNSLVYKHLANAVKHHLVKYEEGSRQSNLKPVLPSTENVGSFLPHPKKVFKANKEIGKRATYVNPLTGKRKTFIRDDHGS